MANEREPGSVEESRREGEQKVVAKKLSLTEKLNAFLIKLGIKSPVRIKVANNGVSLTFPKSAAETKVDEQAIKEAKGGSSNFTRGKDATIFISKLEATPGWQQWSQQMLEAKEIKEAEEAPRILKQAFVTDQKETMVAFISDDAEGTLNQILDRP